MCTEKLLVELMVRGCVFLACLYICSKLHFFSGIGRVAGSRGYLRGCRLTNLSTCKTSFLRIKNYNERLIILSLRTLLAVNRRLIRGVMEIEIKIAICLRGDGHYK